MVSFQYLHPVESDFQRQLSHYPIKKHDSWITNFKKMFYSDHHRAANGRIKQKPEHLCSQATNKPVGIKIIVGRESTLNSIV